MESERWEKLERLYHEASELTPLDRASFLKQACGEDGSLRQEVESLLAESEDAGDFLDAPALEVAAKSLAKSARVNPPAIGRYRIIRLLGEGGMGTVYEAEQDEPRRLVALKVIKLGLATPERLRRFRQESQALARLQHPGIAQIYESSAADTGSGPQPYFAMEYIRGLPLQQYADLHRLSARRKLTLMAGVCDAVQHAHERGLIHRDLKPANILIDETGQPKILDFGVARITGSDDGAAGQTDIGQLVGTLAYMSPEQVSADSLALDARSDVYSLGVILYELLCGRLPYDVKPLQLPEAVRTIRDEEAPSLSAIHRDYRGDIETIVGKALEKDKFRRYASAYELSADIQRYLNDEPIAARPPSANYQLQKFVRRHRGLMAGVAAVFVVLIAGISASTWEAIRANRLGQAALRERDRAVAAEASAVAVNDFLQNDLLAQAGSHAQAGLGIQPDPNLKVRTALDRAAARIPEKFGKEPLVEASIRRTIGNAYVDLGLYPDAQKHLQRSLDLRRSLLGEGHQDTLAVMSDLAWLYRDEGDYAQAEPLASRVADTERRLVGEEDPATMDAMNNLGLIYRYAGKPAQAEALFSAVLKNRRRISGEENPATLFAMNNLGYLDQVEGKYPEAEALLTKVWETRRRVSGNEHPDTLIAADNLATVYYRQKKYAQAESLFAQNLEIRRRVLGDRHPDTTDTTNNLGVVYRAEGKYAQAEPLLAGVLETKRRVLGEQHPSTLMSMLNLGMLYRDKSDYAKAERLVVKAVDLQSRVLGEEHPDRLAGMSRLASLYADEGKYAEAETLYSKALGIQRRVLGDAHPDTLNSESGLHRVQLRQHKVLNRESK